MKLGQLPITLQFWSNLEDYKQCEFSQQPIRSICSYQCDNCSACVTEGTFPCSREKGCARACPWEGFRNQISIYLSIYLSLSAPISAYILCSIINHNNYQFVIMWSGYDNKSKLGKTKCSAIIHCWSQIKRNLQPKTAREIERHTMKAKVCIYCVRTDKHIIFLAGMQHVCSSSNLNNLNRSEKAIQRLSRTALPTKTPD